MKTQIDGSLWFSPRLVSLAMAGLLLASSLGSGCAVDVGSSQGRHPTLGQELEDLKRARDSGAISDSEYEEKKGDLMRNRR
jgi:hypothetical protein